MGGDQQAGARLARHFVQGCVTRLPQALLARPHVAQPAHHDGHVEPVALVDHVLGVLPAVAAHAVVDVADVQWPGQAAFVAQAGQYEQQHRAVDAARNGRQHRPFRHDRLEAVEAAGGGVEQTLETVHWLAAAGR